MRGELGVDKLDLVESSHINREEAAKKDN